NVAGEWIGGRRAPAQLTFEAVDPEECAAEDPVAADGEIVAPLLERLRDMDSAFAQRVGRFVPRAIELLAVRDSGPPRRPEAAVEDAAQACPFVTVLDAPDLPAHDRLGRVRSRLNRRPDSHDI